MENRMTRSRLEKWISGNRPDLGLFETDAGVKGFYRQDAGPAASFQGCGKSWKDVAARLGAIQVPDKD